MDTSIWTADVETYMARFLNMQSFDGALHGKLTDYNVDEGWMNFEFPAQDWQSNEHGGLHGGITASIFDLALGIVCSYYAGERGTTTTDLNVSYISAGELDDTLLVKVYVMNRGKRIYRMRGEIFSKERGKLIATATGSWLAL